MSVSMAKATRMGQKIVIIGAGIAGLTAAIAMARKGLDAEVYEQAPELKEVGAGVGLWGNAFRALRAIGLADEVVRLAGGPAGSGVKRPDGAWLVYQPHEVMQKRWGAGFASVHRAELHRLLADQVDPSAIHLDARCTGISDAGDGVRARFADGREVEADVSSALTGRTRWYGPRCSGLLRSGIAATPQRERSHPRDLSRFRVTGARPGAGASASASRPPAASGSCGTRSGKR